MEKKMMREYEQRVAEVRERDEMEAKELERLRQTQIKRIEDEEKLALTNYIKPVIVNHKNKLTSISRSIYNVYDVWQSPKTRRVFVFQQDKPHDAVIVIDTDNVYVLKVDDQSILAMLREGMDKWPGQKLLLGGDSSFKERVVS